MLPSDLAEPVSFVVPNHRKSVHDLRNLFAVISAATHLLERNPSPTRSKMLFKALEEATLRGGKLTTDLLAGGEGHGQPQIIDIQGKLAELRSMMEALTGTASLSVEVFGLRAMSEVDPAEFEATILEFVANAAHASAKSIRVRSRSGRTCVRIMIADNGCGMSAGMLARARSGQDSGREHGAGLCRARHFADTCGGRLRIKSRPGLGTVVAFEIPLAKLPFDRRVSALRLEAGEHRLDLLTN